MKKTLIVLLLLLVGTVGFTTEYGHYGFTVKCAKCTEMHAKNAKFMINIAWRTHNYKKIDGVTCAEYRCSGGHRYFAEIL